MNLLLRDFIAPPPRPRSWVRGKSRRKRALYVSSPSASGTPSATRRSRTSCASCGPPGIDWLAQHPSPRRSRRGGERIHPASALLANESTHRERVGRARPALLPGDPADGRDPARELHGLRRPRPRRQYDLWIGDEAWELDYYLHENPELKRAAYVWLTDFVGWLPMEDGGSREAFVTADYNAEMIEHIARFPRVRDRAVYVGNAEDIVPASFGPELPLIRDWTEQHYDFAGYVTGFDPRELGDRAALGYRDDERVCIVTVGGSGVGEHLLRRVIAAFPQARRARAGPADDRRRRPASTPRACRGATASRYAPTSTSSTATSPPATWRSSRAASPPPWS